MSDARVADLHPSRHVLEQFGVTEALKAMSGGTTGRCYRAGDVVLKPDQADDVAAWLAQLVEQVAPNPGFRLSHPIPSQSGKWTVEGWAAMSFMEGTHEGGRWVEMLRAGQALHRAIRQLPKPAFLDRRSDRWAVSDRAVWGEVEVDVPKELRAEIGSLTEMATAVESPSQVVHSDLCGNTLLHDGLPPAIIDFSPLFRPAEYAEAILISDAVTWESAPLKLAQDWTTSELHRQMLVRGSLFRLYAAAIAWPEMPDRLGIIAERHAPLSEWLRNWKRA